MASSRVEMQTLPASKNQCLIKKQSLSRNKPYKILFRKDDIEKHLNSTLARRTDPLCTNTIDNLSILQGEREVHWVFDHGKPIQKRSF